MIDLAGVSPAALVASLMVAATPILLAAAGELVVEKSGVLNLGVEGMMIIGAICGFIGAVETGSPLAGLLAAVAGGILLSLIFAVLTQFLLSNQVATGLALTLFGLGLAALMGQSYAGIKPPPTPRLDIPILSEIPFLGPGAFFSRRCPLSVSFPGLCRLVRPAVHPCRTCPPCRRRQSRCGPRTRIQGRPCAPDGDPVRRGHGGSRRRLSFADQGSAVDGRDDGWRRVDCTRDCRFFFLEAMADSSWSLSLRGGHGFATEPAGRGRRDWGCVSVNGSVSRYNTRTGCHVLRPKADQLERSGLSWPGFSRLGLTGDGADTIS